MRKRMRTMAAACVVVATGLGSSAARADTFQAGSLIIPMDVDYQDMGMFKAYGLVYQLLLHGVPVQWTINKNKSFGGVDFTVSANNYATGASVGSHGYRGGPWVIDAADAPKAKPIIDSWQQNNTTVVHVTTSSFDIDVARRLINAPTIAMFADGNQKIARGYVQAAGIPDSTGDLGWPDSSPDMLTPVEVAGPTTSSHRDGALFDANGTPHYCQLMSMHWGVKDARKIPEVVAEVRSFLHFPTHFFAECQAVNAFENDPVYGMFLTPHGFDISDRPSQVDFFNPTSPFVQFDGAFATVGGSEPSYTLPAGDKYKAGGITMITGKGTPEGDHDVWMTGYLDGTCPPGSDMCFSLGKISYLGGHQYHTDVPISQNPDSQGTRLFLNSLFEAPCATDSGQPHVWLAKQAPASTTTPQVQFVIDWANNGPGIAYDVKVVDPLPQGSTFVSASGSGALQGSQVEWSLGDLNGGSSGQVKLTVSFSGYGTYNNTARLDYRVGLTPRTMPSNTTTTVYGAATDAGAAGAAGAGGSNTGGTGGSGTGGSSTGGSSTGGSGTGGSSTGGTGTAGAAGSGTAGTGGSSTGGTGTAGAAGSGTAGTAGSSTGGTGTAGAAGSGTAGTAGSSTGGTGTAGAAGSGTAGTAGSSTGGTGTAGSAGTGTAGSGAAGTGLAGSGGAGGYPQDGGSQDASSPSDQTSDDSGDTGSCSCGVAGESHSSGWWWLLSLAGLALLRRRRGR